MEYYYKEVSPNTIADIQFLIKAVYGRESTLESLNKKYDTTKSGLYTVGYLAYSKSNDEPAGYYGVFPTVFEYDGKTVLAAQSGDTMTHPSHRRKGLFVTLATMTYDLAKNKGVEFVFGFPVEASYQGFVKKLNWRHDSNIKKLDFFIFTFPLSSIQRLSQNFYLKFVNIFFSNSKSENIYPFMNQELRNPKIKRSFDFYHYKDKKNNFKFMFLGLNIWYQIKGETMIIADLEYNQKLKTKSVISRLKFLAFLMGILRVSFHLSPNSVFATKLSGQYDLKEGLAIGYVDLLETQLPLKEMCFTYADFDTF
ncbi:GNAT family N-acetyltransferase [Olleya sp. HaHaR_3_96]|uniref:GNAT family N-acetyltransferase n=1 Tax=Olleya sp. HaHaR_3_96 TaxID=2745560 RepID=UPI001C4E52AE|nr:GNAT family N-acetyltransferase [Olleya sp. HaHaR_3_96]QXP60663.1 GNAT family N-acetyltransferase [Olleya sp. HaHaR_3_96]